MRKKKSKDEAGILREYKKFDPTKHPALKLKRAKKSKPKRKQRDESTVTYESWVDEGNWWFRGMTVDD